MSWTIVNTLDLDGAPEAIEALEAVATFISLPPERAAVLSRIGEADAYLCSASVRIDAEFLDHAPRLKVIGSPSTGTDHMDVEEIRARNIELYDIAKERDLLNGFTATSELAFGLLLSLARHLPPALSAAREGDWARERFSGIQLFDKTLGILGLGRLGTISARIGNGFGMRVIANDIRKVHVKNVKMVDFNTLLKEADYLLIHIHLTPETDGLIDQSAIAKMKPGALLINTSRGRIVDEDALLEALKNGHLGGAGLDVIDGEWMADEERYKHPLVSYSRENEHLIISPHIGGATRESIYGARVFMARKLAKYVEENSNAGRN